MKDTCQLPKSGPRALAMRIRILSFALEREVDRALAEKGNVTLAQFMLLMPVAMHPGITQRAIAATRNLTEAAISRQAEVLRQKGYLERGRNPAMKRERALYLTTSGQAIVESAGKHVDERLEMLFAKLEPAQREATVKALDGVIESVGLECPTVEKSASREMAKAA